MACKDREGNIVTENETQDKLLEKLYGTETGRKALKMFVQPAVSKAGGWFLESKLSIPFISPFIDRNNISMEEYEEGDYESFNHFFTRRIKEGEREFSQEGNALCSPCDARLSFYPVTAEGSFTVKNTEYTMESLVQSKKLADRYLGGTLCIFRLTVEDYHHYAYIDEGTKTKNYKIPGVFHTVNPLANEKYPVYTENAREFSILKSKNFGNVLMMEVGALFVGRIVNHHEKMAVQRGMEKGYFEFGGSTVILVFEKGRIALAEDIVKNNKDGFETAVKMGEVIGKK
ncbi:phosphatidylserine decarboxylase [bacterium D16-51]|nr:phosphatidylserine decarboxylase [bacterium D16-59]RKI60919.1 phosphatidylserine decarboxylase [bacterium D16-51]